MDQETWKKTYPIHALACEVDGKGLEELIQVKKKEDKNQLSLLIDQLDYEGRAPIHYAAWNGLSIPCKILIEAGANVNITTPDRKSTPLHFAAGMGKLETCQVLLENHATPDLKDIDKWTPIDLAKQNLFGLPEIEVEKIVSLIASFVTR